MKDEQGRGGAGEIAPVPWFGTETVEAALVVCRRLEGDRTDAFLEAALESAGPCTRFGFGCALEELDGSGVGRRRGAAPAAPRAARLLPAGSAVLEAWQSHWSNGYRTFKWKVGVEEGKDERVLLRKLLAALPAEARLRLDANGAFSAAGCAAWMEALAGEPRVEFLEQPMPPGYERKMASMAEASGVRVALDESVATREQAERCGAEWPGIFVLKPALFGAPRELRAWRRGREDRIVYSTAFEIGPGGAAVRALAAEAPSRFAPGFPVA